MHALVQACGVYCVGLAVFHIFFWKIFRWKQELKTAAVSTRAFIQIANLRLIFIFLLVAFLCFRFTTELHSTALGRAFMGGMALFWLGRFIEQFIFLRYNAVMIHVLTVVFAIGVGLFSVPAVVGSKNPVVGQQTRELDGLDITYAYAGGLKFRLRYTSEGILYQVLSKGAPEKWWGPFPYKAYKTVNGEYFVGWYEGGFGDQITQLVNLEAKTLYGSGIIVKGKRVLEHFDTAVIEKVSR